MIEIKDCGSYFKVTFDGLETSTYPKFFSGFKTKGELYYYLINEFKR